MSKFGLFFIALAVSCCLSTSAYSESDQQQTEAEAATESAELESIINLIELRDKKAAKLVKESEATNEELKEQETIESAAELHQQIDVIEKQISALASGVSETDFDLASGNTIDLKAEAEQLIQPFIIMLRSATEDARQIEGLRRKLSIAKSNREIAGHALQQLALLMEKSKEKVLNNELTKLKSDWQQRYESANDLTVATDRQLQLKMEQRTSPSDSANEMASSFFRERGLNLLKGVGVFLLTMVGLRFIGSLIGRFRQSQNIGKTFASRLTALLFKIGTLFAALIGMMVVFNNANDWVLLGITVLFTVAMIWFAVKALPSLLEQITLYLNLGAVQEDERLMFNGIPWVVEKLDFYTDLVNPELEGGTFTLPIRQLTGLHSRPYAESEAWFPTKKGDWVKTDEGLGKILIQSPGVVQVEILGGAILSYPAAAFFEQAPVNLSHGSRVEIKFGVSYKHQTIATKEIPEKLKAFVTSGLLEILSESQLLNVEIELLQANDSSIDYEVEADISGDAAPYYETIERSLAKLCIEACNKHGWEIPFPQMVMHQA